MKNTRIAYSSTEKSPVVLPEFAGLLPPLGAEQFSALEADILANGCYTPIIVDESLTIIDGHNRHKICTEHGIPYTMLMFSFTDALEAKQWALETQKGRRNLTLWNLGQIALKMKPDMEARAKENQGSRTDLCMNSDKRERIDTRQQLADAVGISRDTMSRIMRIEEKAPPAVRKALDNGELSINQGYHITRAVQQFPEEQRDLAAADAVKQGKSDTEQSQRRKVSKQFSAAYEKAALLTPTEEAVRIWTEYSRMTPDMLKDTVRKSQALADVFSSIAGIIQTKILSTS